VLIGGHLHVRTKQSSLGSPGTEIHQCPPRDSISCESGGTCMTACLLNTGKRPQASSNLSSLTKAVSWVWDTFHRTFVCYWSIKGLSWGADKEKRKERKRVRLVLLMRLMRLDLHSAKTLTHWLIGSASHWQWLIDSLTHWLRRRKERELLLPHLCRSILHLFLKLSTLASIF